MLASGCHTQRPWLGDWARLMGGGTTCLFNGSGAQVITWWGWSVVDECTQWALSCEAEAAFEWLAGKSWDFGGLLVERCVSSLGCGGTCAQY